MANASKMSVKQAALSLGLLIALVNAFAALIGSSLLPIQGASLLRLVVGGFIGGAIIGAIFAVIWNWVGEKVK